MLLGQWTSVNNGSWPRLIGTSILAVQFLTERQAEPRLFASSAPAGNIFYQSLDLGLYSKV